MTIDNEIPTEFEPQDKEIERQIENHDQEALMRVSFSSHTTIKMTCYLK